MIPVKTQIHTLEVSDFSQPVTAVTIGGEEVLKVNAEASWEIERVFTDYHPDDTHHEALVVVFRRKDV